MVTSPLSQSLRIPQVRIEMKAQLHMAVSARCGGGTRSREVTHVIRPLSAYANEAMQGHSCSLGLSKARSSLAVFQMAS